MKSVAEAEEQESPGSQSAPGGEVSRHTRDERRARAIEIANEIGEPWCLGHSSPGENADGCKWCEDGIKLDVVDILVGALTPSLEWQPIATAPRDGTSILACLPGHYVPQTVCWASYHPNATGKTCWRTAPISGNKVGRITHWMPLPPKPPKL